MNIKNLVTYAALLSLGVILHAMTPGLLGNMKPDFLLATFFICITIAPSFKDVLIVSIACAFLASLTTSLPGGEIANIVDKLITGPVMYFVLTKLKSLDSMIKIALFSFIGTLLSGLLFLLTLMVMNVLPLELSTLFISLVVPTAIANMIFFTFLYKGFKRVSPAA
ncbi:hypothetical protein AOC36_10105 [Erysipelothrix larvae]|uniref:Tryptophan transporter n=1 Tax=Erysipelothrix larvae TaxID=1514105 RepID=A0A0X8H1I5_9FIRM|nr:tryptophan transporter [Erysipelothrix larvae]AMC94311.1 hypothetical protein AOC36_10105 [Erysipelothrix larvae]